VKDGWNYTGDAYLVDADGDFVYQARTDDMIVSAGYNIAGPEVESALLLHPAVAECGVIGAPDEERGQIVKAFVVLKRGHAPDPPWRASCRNSSSARSRRTSIPRAVEFLDALPRTETGKLQRFRLRQTEQAARGLHRVEPRTGAGAPASDNPFCPAATPVPGGGEPTYRGALR